jgi:hypothetical protein
MSKHYPILVSIHAIFFCLPAADYNSNSPSKGYAATNCYMSYFLDFCFYACSESTMYDIAEFMLRLRSCNAICNG